MVKPLALWNETPYGGLYFICSTTTLNHQSTRIARWNTYSLGQIPQSQSIVHLYVVVNTRFPSGIDYYI